MKNFSKVIQPLTLGIAFILLSTASGLADPKRGGDFIFGGSGFPRHYISSIQSGVDIGIAAAQIFVALVEMSHDLRPIPYLAKSWQKSQDGLTYTFQLEEGTFFTDGKPVTSKDVAFSINLTKKNHNFGPYMYGVLDSVETPDKYTVVIKLKQPNPVMMIALGFPFTPILPEHVYGEHNGPIRKNPANLKPIGSGPFKLKESNPGQDYILERNDNFFRKGQPYLDRIIFKRIVGDSTQLISISRNEIHMNSTGDPQFVTKLRALKHLKMTENMINNMGMMASLDFNLRNKYLKEKRVRQAIAYALDMDFVTRILHRGISRNATGPMTSTHPLYSSHVKQYDLDLNKANQLLDEAGFKRGTGGMRFSLKVLYPPFTPYSQQTVVEYMKPQLKKIGINIEVVKAADFMSWWKDVAGWNFDMTTNNVSMWGDPMIGIHRLFMSNNIKHLVWTNTTGYVNKEVDDILLQAAKENDQNKRKALYAKFQKIVVEELPSYYYLEEVITTGYHKDLVGMPADRIWVIHPFDRVHWKGGRMP